MTEKEQVLAYLSSQKPTKEVLKRRAVREAGQLLASVFAETLAKRPDPRRKFADQPNDYK